MELLPGEDLPFRLLQVAVARDAEDQLRAAWAGLDHPGVHAALARLDAAAPKSAAERAAFVKVAL